jgi:perosamine synthetase
MSIPEKINIAQPTFLGNEKKYLLDTIESGWISSIGPYIEKFEHEFARIHGVKHAVATHNGTIALHLALAAAGIGPGDEVIVPDFTFVASANAVRYCNATPILTDIRPDDWNLDPEAVQAVITQATRAIMPVHIYGNPARMRELMAIAGSHGLLVIEDCAEAIGAEYNGRKVGTFGDIGCFSFFGNKIITTGEGGMCITNNDELAERMRIFRDHGMNRNRKYWYDFLGFNYRMTNMQAAVGLAQLEQLEDLLHARDHIFKAYTNRLQGHPRIRLQETNGQRNVNWIFTLRIKGAGESVRDRIMAFMKENQIDSRPAFYPIHRMDFYHGHAYCPAIPENCIGVSREGISLPTFVGLKQNDIDYIANVLEQSLVNNL